MHKPESLHLEEVLERCQVVSLPMRVRFRGIDHREALLIEGDAGWGEFAPFLEYGAREAAPWLASALESAFTPPPPARHARIPINATVPAVTPDQVPGILARFPGAKTIKVKVAEPGQSLVDDLARIHAVRTFAPTATIRADANGAWTVPQALEAARVLELNGYLEQPCGSLEELIQLKEVATQEGVAVTIAADESIRKVEDPYEVARRQAAV